MDSNSSVAIMFIAAFLVVAFIINRILNYRVKSKMIRAGFIDQGSINLLKELNGDTRLAALKWALSLFFGGLGLVVLQFLPYSLNSPMPYGIEAILLAMGFFIYYLVVFKRGE